MVFFEIRKKFLLSAPFLFCSGCSDQLPPDYLGCYVSKNAPSFKLINDSIVFHQGGSIKSKMRFFKNKVGDTIEPLIGIKLKNLSPDKNVFDFGMDGGQIILIEPQNSKVLSMESSNRSVVMWIKSSCR